VAKLESRARAALKNLSAVKNLINMGRKEVYTTEDKWTVVTEDGKPSAHFEHTVAVRKSGPEILTTFEFIEEAVYSIAV